MNIGDLIKQKRLDKGFTLEQLGKRVGVSKMTVLRWESGEIKNIKSDKIEKLANALDIPIISLFKDFDDNGIKIDGADEISPEQFMSEVEELLNKTANLSEQHKQHLLSTLKFVCSDDK
jgi:transcriptional regulator with XRE-family HTH domain